MVARMAENKWGDHLADALSLRPSCPRDNADAVPPDSGAACGVFLRPLPGAVSTPTITSLCAACILWALPYELDWGAPAEEAARPATGRVVNRFVSGLPRVCRRKDPRTPDRRSRRTSHGLHRHYCRDRLRATL